METMTTPADRTQHRGGEPPVRIRRAILSAYDKTGLSDLARTLQKFGVEIISTGGTMKTLAAEGIPVTPAESITGFGSLLGGRLKTLHPNLLGGILGRPGVENDRREMAENGIVPCELVVVNLYPFARAADDPKASFGDAIELIDVGGPTMIRAAAKNHAWVTVVCDPADYAVVRRELEDSDGQIAAATRRHLAARAFAITAAYDARIAEHLAAHSGGADLDRFPSIWVQSYEKVGALRYGENPHQKAAVYHAAGSFGPSLATAQVHGGKELSYNNYGDLDAAWRMAADFVEPFAAVFKHANPCGAACARTIRDAYQAAHDTDPLSAYGSVIALNRTVDVECAEALNATTFIECVLAPGYDPDAMKQMLGKKTRRYITVPTMDLTALRLRFRELVGGLLIQDEDQAALTAADLRVVTDSTPTDEQIQALLFARKVVKHAKSNAIVIAQGHVAVGIGSGQTSRVDAARSAVERAGDRARGAVIASDAFFPMRDGIDVLAKAGVAAIIQPGGSKRDEEVIAACDEHGIAMVFSGIRNFRH